MVLQYMHEYFVERYAQEAKQIVRGKMILPPPPRCKIPLDICKQILGSDSLDAQTMYSIRLYCYGGVGMTREWLMTDNITPAETVVEMMFNSMPENIRSIFLANNKSSRIIH